MNIWVGVGFVTIYSALWTRRWFDDRDRKRLVAAHQAREARELAQAKLDEQATRIRAKTNTMRGMIDAAIEESRAVEEARFMGLLAQNPEMAETYTDICGLRNFEPAEWWKVSK